MIRLGCLPYLNVKPLIYPFEHGGLPEGWETVYEPPSTLARMLAEETLDVAPVSSFACFINPELVIVPDICIASHGRVDTVLLLSKVPVAEIRTIALDTSSLSGASLLKIILKERYCLSPMFVLHPPVAETMLEVADAALIIGNPAMLADKSGLHVLDLGQEWLELTGLPMVFAVWTGPQGRVTREVVDVLKSVKACGMKMIDEISREECPRLGVSAEYCREYLTRRIFFELGPSEFEGLRTFAQKAFEHKLIERMPDLRMAGDV